MNTYQDKQLVDESGLAGIYDITLRVATSAVQSAPGGGPPPEELGNALMVAAEQAGFKFISKKELLPVIIVDHIDPPTPN